jgi:hypothetical protein
LHKSLKFLILHYINTKHINMILDLKTIGELKINLSTQNLLIMSLETMKEELNDLLKDKLENAQIIFYNEKLEEIEDIIFILKSM